MKKKILVMLAMLLVASFVLVACSSSTTPADTAEKPADESAGTEADTETNGAEGKVIGISCMDTTWQFFVPVNEAFMAAAEANGITVNMQDAQNDAATQMNQVESFINQGVDAIVIDTIDEGSLVNLVAEAVAAGIPVIGRWTAIPGASCNMTLDEYGYGVAIGTLAAEWANANYPGEAIEIAIMGKYDYKPSVERIQGIKDTLAANFPTGIVVAEEQSNSIEVAMNATDAVLQAHPNVKILLGDDDDSGVGICQSVMAFTTPDKYAEYYVGGADAVDEAIRLIKEGTPYKGTVDLHNYDIGTATIQLLVDYFNGKGMPESYLFNFDPLSYDQVMATK